MSPSSSTAPARGVIPRETSKRARNTAAKLMLEEILGKSNDLVAVQES